MNCMICQKHLEDDEINWISMTFLSTEEIPEHQENCASCHNCKILFETPRQITFQVINGPGYTNKNRPPFWHNDAPLDYEHYHVAHGQLPYLYNELPHIDPERYAYFIKENVLDIKQLPLHAFPLIEDFEMLLEQLIYEYESGEKSMSDVFVWLFSPSRGYLAHIVDHDTHQHLSRPDFVIPHGDFQTPYADLAQGWDILMAEDETFVYVLTGNWELHEGYRTWFKIEKDRYYRQWERAIQRCREISDKEHSIKRDSETD